MSPGRTSQPLESGEAATPAAIDAPMPSDVAPSQPTSGRTTTSRAATLLRATSTNAAVVTTTVRRWLAIALRERLREHVECAERLGELVAAGAETLAAAGGENDDGALWATCGGGWKSTTAIQESGRST